MSNADIAAADAIERLTRERDLLRQRADHSLSPELLQQVNIEHNARLAAEAREAKLREALETISARDGWFDGDSVRIARAALATEGEHMPVHQNDGRVTTSATVPTAPRPDPEAVELAERLDALRRLLSVELDDDGATVFRRAAACLRRLGGVE